MGSAPSTPNQDRTSDPWWSIENQTLELSPPTMSTNSERNDGVEQTQQIHEMDETGQSQVASNATVHNSSNDRENIVEEQISEIAIEKIESSTKSANDEDEKVPSVEINKSERQQSLEEFKEELRIKREMRKCAIAELRNEITNLRRELAEEKALNKQLASEKSRDNCDNSDSNSNSAPSDVADDSTKTALRSQLSDTQYSLQIANAEILSLTSELTVTKRQTQSLKDVIAASKQMLEIRETELSQLRTKLREIEDSLAERELRLMSENLRQEYDRQLANIRHLKALYEERSRVNAAEKENLNRQLETSRAEFSAECEKNKNLTERLTSLEEELKSTNEDLLATREQMTYYKSESRNLHEEMAVINQLFSQLLAGFSGNNDIDIDRLTHMLEENRDLINDITSKESCKVGAAQIPKLLLDIITPMENGSESENVENSMLDAEIAETSAEIAGPSSKVTTPQEIVHNLPKVWKVLVELLSHQKLKPVEIEENTQNEHCYKSIETPAGPKMVLSLSKTYIRLKDLILEKKFLQKETKKLKNLNSHLENRLEEQENRLGAVTVELKKTWTLVGRMQRQHRQLHTHEQVLRYQLQQKRRMLNELKEELEYCRRKWALAKEKNTESQNQWDLLRTEFRNRKSQDSNNSAESGYSDGPASDEEFDHNNLDLETGIATEANTSTGTKRKIKKEKFSPKSNEHKILRIQSVSPNRCVRIGLSRRNSESHVTQFATEEFQAQSDIVEPIVLTNCTENCDENCVLHSVHFDNNSIDPQQQSDQIKVTEPIVRNANSSKTQAQKLIEAKASKCKTKMCCELRKVAASTSRSGDEESLEDMFMRLSGQEKSPETVDTKTEENHDEATGSDCKPEESQVEPSNMCSEECCTGETMQILDEASELTSNDEECTESSNPKHIDNQLTENENSNPLNDQSPVPSTSARITSKTDDDCLTSAERSYTQRRDERLKRLEAEYNAFMKKMEKTNRRGTDVENKLQYLHGKYGSESAIDKNDQLKMENDSTPVSTSDSQPSTSTSSENAPKNDEDCLTTAEQSYTQRRDERLKRLEAEYETFMKKMKSTNRRGADVENRLQYLHDRYGSDPTLGQPRFDSSQNLESANENENVETEQTNASETGAPNPVEENNEVPSDDNQENIDDNQ